MKSPSQVQTESNARLNAIRNPLLLDRSLSAVAYAIEGLRDMPGRKAIALFSDGFGQTPTGLIQMANRASVVIYTLDPRGVASFFLSAADHCECALRAGTALIRGSEHSRQASFRMSQKGMEQLAAGTGGIFFHDNNDLTQGLSGALADMSGYYLIGYQPQRADFDRIQGAVPFHRIQVRLRRPGLTVRTRNGFYGTPDAPPAPAGDPLLTALRSPFQANGVPVYLSAVYLSSALRAILIVDARDLKREDLPNGKQLISLDILGGLWDGTDKQIARIDRTYSLEKTPAEMDAAVRSGLAVELDIPAAAPGPYQMRAAVRAVNTGLLGSASSFVQIPDYRKHRISMSSVLLSDNDAGRAELLEARGVIGAGSPAMRIFASGATLNYVGEIFGAKARVDIQVDLYRGPEHIFTGKPIVLAAAAENPLHASGTVKLPDFLPPGDYALELTAFDGEASPKRPHVSQWVDFRLVDTKAPVPSL